MPAVTTDRTLPFLAIMEQLKPSLMHDVHLLSREEQLSAIYIMRDAISQIKYNMNARMPVQRLPPELLTLVFEYAIYRDPRYALRNAVRMDRNQKPSEPAYIALIPITYVCRVWRNVACAAPHLWARVDNGQIARVNTFIQRSQALPLSVIFSWTADPHLEQLFESCGSRLHRLDIVHGRKLILPRGQVDGSRLECVTIAAPFSCPVGNVDPRAAAFEQSISTLQGLALNLEGGYWVPNAHFPNLTHLFLVNCFGQSIHCDVPILEPLTTMLIGTPRLQYLHLVRLPVAPSPSTPQPVSLPQLKLFLCKSCDPDTSLHLLSLLRLPPAVFVALDGLFRYSVGHMPTTSNALGHYHLLEGEWMLSLIRLEITISSGTQFVVAEGYRTGLWLNTDERFRFCLLQPMFPFGSVRALDFFAEHDSQSAEHDSQTAEHHRQQLQDVLDFTPSLVSLRFPALSTKGASSPMGGTSCCTLDDKLLLPLMPSEGDAPIRCPLLAELCIEGPPEELEELAPHIADLLAARARAGVPLRSLALRVPPRIYATNPPPEDLVLVRERLQREVFNAAACYVEELNIELDVDGPGELATRGTYWDVELSVEAEKYWLTADYLAPPWFNSSIEDL